jgi:hypothetical protein
VDVVVCNGHSDLEVHTSTVNPNVEFFAGQGVQAVGRILAYGQRISVAYGDSG